MQKVWGAPPAPRITPRKKKRAKRVKGHGPAINHVLMASKYDGTCKWCARRVEVGDKIWWSAKDRYVVHFYCFEGFMKEKSE